MEVKNLNISCTIKIPIELQTIKCNVILQIFIGKNKPDEVEEKGKYWMDVDICDYEDLQYMGMKIEDSYKGTDKLRKSLSEFGINLDEMIDGEVQKQYTKESIIELLKPQLDIL